MGFNIGNFTNQRKLTNLKIKTVYYITKAN